MFFFFNVLKKEAHCNFCHVMLKYRLELKAHSFYCFNFFILDPQLYNYRTSQYISLHNSINLKILRSILFFTIYDVDE